MPEFFKYNKCLDVLVCVNSKMRSKSVMHISPIVRIKLSMRKRDVSELARKICAPNSMLKCFKRILRRSVSLIASMT